MILDMGCGNRKLDADWGADIRPGPKVNTVMDMEITPWPFGDGQFSGIRLHHVLEHLKPWRMLDVMNEAHRVIEVGGLAEIAMPYPGSPRFWQDPTHVHAWNEVTPRYFDPDFPNWYTVYRPKPWKILQCRAEREGDIAVVLEARPWTSV